MFFDSRSPVAEKVKEQEPLEAREGTTERAVWVGVFGGECCLWFALPFLGWLLG